MPQLLLEFLTEEIPARMQARAASDLAALLSRALGAAGLDFESLDTFAGPRRLTAVVEGLPVASPDVREERKGPRVGAPEKALAGFLRGAGLDDIGQAEQREDKKGAYYVAVIAREGRPTPDLVAEAVSDIIAGFPWPKSMRWGTGSVRWVRPLQRILCVFDGRVVPFSVAGIESGNVTEGHRVMHRGPFLVANFKAYREALEHQGHVLIDAGERAAKIHADAQMVCADAGLELVDDPGLLAEVAGLVEWPVVLLGEMDPAFLDLPPEVIRLSMRTHQKYFAVRDPKTGGLAPKFVVVANQEAPDGGLAIAAGNARVLSARLSDARHFWSNDRKVSLAENAKRLKSIVFHAKLGSLADKTERVAALARELAVPLGADPDVVEIAARLAKADLVSEMVYEFPELQGVMGRYYALIEAGFDPLDAGKKRKKTSGAVSGSGSGSVSGLLGKLPAKDAQAVADALGEHYKPQGPGDVVPAHPVSVAVALADKLDTLTGFWAIGEKPTGSGDPFALRRAALGVVRILLEGKYRLSLRTFLGHDASLADLFAFIGDRLKVYLRDQGARHDLLDAVFALGGDDLVLVVKRVEALAGFLDSADGAELLAGNKRAANILRAEAKKEKKSVSDYAVAVDETLFSQEEETALFAALATARSEAATAVEAEDFAAAMGALAPLRPIVDAFFDAVTVNVDDPKLRANRLALLSQLPHALGAVADFSKIGG